MRLIDRVSSFLSANKGPSGVLSVDRGGQPADLEMRATVAVLLLEAAYGDTEYAWHEEKALERGLEREFGIGRKQTLALLESAEEIRPPIVKLDDLTQVVTERFDVEQRKRIVALLWKVVDADGVLESWEEVFASHVATAVGLSAAEATEARQMARAGSL